MNITFIGGGNMAAAMIGGLLKRGWQPQRLRAVEISAQARERLERDFGIAACAGMETGVAGADCVVLAVKPQQLRDAAKVLRRLLGAQLVVSIAAGVRCADLSRWLGGYARIVRAMPNTPALVGAGIAGLYAMPAVDAAGREQAQAVLDAVGETLWFEREPELDAVTAVSGSGPAYVFYFIEALQAAAAELGLAPEAARRLALQTFRGAVALAAQGEEPALLRARVTSRGGTTERALAALEADAVLPAIVRAVKAAAERSRELGEELGRD
jgi:pyrroline-5-carboxylate reductase